MDEIQVGTQTKPESLREICIPLAPSAVDLPKAVGRSAIAQRDF
ncbi:hypothetical protein Q5692_15060 [Microcoleus sp. C2C3]